MDVSVPFVLRGAAKARAKHVLPDQKVTKQGSTVTCPSFPQTDRHAMRLQLNFFCSPNLPLFLWNVILRHLVVFL